MAYNDKYPSLSPIIDVGGERYYLGSEIPIEYAYRSRKDFMKTFGDDPVTEVLLRKYMFEGYDYTKIPFADDIEKQMLLQILKRRLNGMEFSMKAEMGSSVLKNSYIQRNYITLKRIIDYLTDPSTVMYTPLDIDIKGAFNKLVQSKKTKQISYIKSLPREKLTELIMEILWYLIHPNELPDKIRGDYFSMVTNMAKMDLKEIINAMKSVDPNFENTIMEYVDKIKKTPAEISVETPVENSVETPAEKSEETPKVGGNPINISSQLQNVMKLLHLKSIIGNDTFGKLIKGKIPLLKGGNIENMDNSSLENNYIPINTNEVINNTVYSTTSPYFHYFEVIYGDLYKVLNEAIESYPRLSEIKLDNVIHLFYILSNINPTSIDSTKDGIYRLHNMDTVTFDFIKSIINKLKTTYNPNILKIIGILPKIRVSSFLKNNSGYNVPYIGLFIRDVNITPKENISQKNINDYLEDDTLYAICAKDDTLSLVEGNITNFFSINVKDVNFKSISGLGIKKENINITGDLRSVYDIQSDLSITLPMMPLIIILLYKNIQL